MSYTPTRLVGPSQPSTASGVFYTVPAGKSVIVKQIVIANTTGSAATVTLGIGGVAVANQIIPAVSVAANTTVTINLSIPMAAAETINAVQGTLAAITVTIGGVVIA